MEESVVAEGADGERLGVILEGVGRGFRALVDDGEFAALLEEIEGGIGAGAVNAARSYVTGDAEVADVGFVAHTLEFTDRDIVAFVISTAGEGQIADGGQNDHCGDDKFYWALLGFVCHIVQVPVYFQLERPMTPTGSILCKVFQKLDLGLDFTVDVPGVPKFFFEERADRTVVFVKSFLFLFSRLERDQPKDAVGSRLLDLSFELIFESFQRTVHGSRFSSGALLRRILTR